MRQEARGRKVNLIAIITMFALYGMVGFVTNLAAPLGDVWKAQPGINGSNALGMMGNTKRMCLCAKCIKSGKVAKA